MKPLMDKDIVDRNILNFQNMIKEYEENKTDTGVNEYDLDDYYGNVHWVDYPYIGIGKKPKKQKRIPTEDDIERIIGG